MRIYKLLFDEFANLWLLHYCLKGNTWPSLTTAISPLERSFWPREVRKRLGVLGLGTCIFQRLGANANSNSHTLTDLTTEVVSTCVGWYTVLDCVFVCVHVRVWQKQRRPHRDARLLLMMSESQPVSWAADLMNPNCIDDLWAQLWSDFPDSLGVFFQLFEAGAAGTIDQRQIFLKAPPTKSVVGYITWTVISCCSCGLVHSKCMPSFQSTTVSRGMEVRDRLIKKKEQ